MRRSEKKKKKKNSLKKGEGIPLLNFEGVKESHL